MGPVPKGVFLTKGVGRHREKLTAFELALRSAGIAEFNLVRVKSIFPPHCKLISQQEGMRAVDRNGPPSCGAAAPSQSWALRGTDKV